MLRRLRGVVVEPDAFDWESVPDHLKFTFQVRDARNKILGEGKDIRELQQKLHAQIRSALADSLGASEDTVAKMAALAGGNSAQGASSRTGSAQQGVKKNSASSGAKPGKAAAQGAGSQDSIRETTGLTDFPGEEIPRKVQRIIATQAVSGYPALVDEKRAWASVFSPPRPSRYIRSGAVLFVFCSCRCPPRTVRERSPVK